jgi:uncharacterized membrane protein YgaE (UPF0421/DUF939 family)
MFEFICGIITALLVVNILLSLKMRKEYKSLVADYQGIIEQYKLSFKEVKNIDNRTIDEYRRIVEEQHKHMEEIINSDYNDRGY